MNKDTKIKKTNERKERSCKSSKFLGGYSVWILVMAFKFSQAQIISRVENITLFAENYIEEKTTKMDEIVRFSGSLIQQVDVQKARTTLLYDFRLVKDEEAIQRKSYRVRVEVVVDSKKVSNGTYEDSYDSDDQSRFNLAVFQQNSKLRGIEPRSELGGLEIENLSFKASLTQTKEIMNQTRLITMSLEVKRVDQTGAVLKQKYFILNFSSNQNAQEIAGNTWRLYTLYIPWLLPLTFLDLIAYFVMASLSFLILRQVSNAAINEDLHEGYQSSDALFLYEDFNAFYKLKIIGFASFGFLYRSPWSFLLFIVFFFLEFIGQFFIWLLPYFVAEDTFGKKFREREIYTEPLGMITYDLFQLKLNGALLYKKNIFGILVSLGGLVTAIIYPVFLLDIHWVLALGAVYCSVLTRYKNPSLVDFLSWIPFLWLCIWVSFCFVSWYLATAYTTVFLENVFIIWAQLVALQWKGLLKSLGWMTGLIFLDFFVIKTDIIRLIFPPKIKISSKIPKKEAIHQPGVISFDDTPTIQLRSMVVSGNHQLDKDQKKMIKFEYKQPPEFSSKSLAWKLKLEYQNIGETFLVDRVVSRGKERPHLVAFLRRSGRDKLMLKLFNLRTKIVDFTSVYNIGAGAMDEIEGSDWPPKALQIKDDDNMLIFFSSPGRDQSRLGVSWLTKIKQKDSLFAILHLKHFSLKDDNHVDQEDNDGNVSRLSRESLLTKNSIVRNLLLFLPFFHNL